MPRDADERAAQLPILGERFRAVDEPEIELVVDDVTLARRQRRDVVVEVVDQMSRMDAEKTRHERPRLAGQMAALAALDLGEIGLAETAAALLADGLADLDLGHLAVETARVTLESAEPGELFAKCHNNLQYIADCYISQARPLSPCNLNDIRQHCRCGRHRSGSFSDEEHLPCRPRPN